MSLSSSPRHTPLSHLHEAPTSSTAAVTTTTTTTTLTLSTLSTASRRKKPSGQNRRNTDDILNFNLAPSERTNGLDHASADEGGNLNKNNDNDDHDGSRIENSDDKSIIEEINGGVSSLLDVKKHVSSLGAPVKTAPLAQPETAPPSTESTPQSSLSPAHPPQSTSTLSALTPVSNEIVKDDALTAPPPAPPAYLQGYSSTPWAASPLGPPP